MIHMETGVLKKKSGDAVTQHSGKKRKTPTKKSAHLLMDGVTMSDHA